MRTLAIYVGAAAAEIAGCFALWAVVRNGASTLWLAPGVLSLVLFGWLLTKVDVDFAGRAYAVYGGIYIAASLVWLWMRRRADAGSVGSHRRRRGDRGRADHSIHAPLCLKLQSLLSAKAPLPEI